MDYNTSLSALLDVHTSALTKTDFLHPNSLLFLDELAEGERKKRLAEQMWISSPLAISLDILKQTKICHFNLYEEAKL